MSTEGWNINQDSSIVGYYDTEDGRRHGFIAKITDASKRPEASPDAGLSLSTVFTFASADANTAFGYT